MKKITTAVGLFLIIGVSFTALASDQVGIYARIDSVEVSHGSPETILIRGNFAFSDLQSGFYKAPRRGYLYYTLPGSEKEKDMARIEWSELEKLGPRECVGIGGRRDPLHPAKPAKLGKVRTDAVPSNPDIYPLANGLVKPDVDNPECKRL